MKIIEVSLTIFYIFICIGIGIWARKKVSSSTDDYWVAGRKIGTFANSWALMAALGSGGSILGVNGLAYAAGVPYVFAMFAGAVVGFPFAAILVAGHLRDLKVRTVPEYLTIRYNNKILSVIVPIIIMVAMEVYVVAQLKAAGITVVYLLDLPYSYAVIITAIVFTLYVSIGGMWAITLTDVMQGILMFVVAIGLSLVIFASFGGVTPLLAKATTAAPHFGQIKEMSFISYLGAFVVWLVAACCVPHLVMRVFTARDSQSAKLSLNYSMVTYAILIFVMVLAVASAGHVVFPGLKDADTVFLKVMEHYLPSALIRGIAVAAIMAAVMSTTDALILAVSSAAVNDIYKQFINREASDKTVVKVGLVMTWVAGLLAIYFALNPPKLLTMLYSLAVGLIGSSLLAPIVLGIWWKKATPVAALLSCITGGTCYCYLSVVKTMPPLSHILVSIPLSFVVLVVASYFTKTTDPRIMSLVTKVHESGEIDS
ncbi:MAG: hypothetical protein CSA26_01625 [Desulfobacterales bacterium]|nr:MAG: hypothetical protein CSA26_01625 [Desulfobacterales bacterium]